MTGHGSIESAVEAMKLGAYDYIQKPFRVEELRMLLRRMEEKIRLVQENRALRERVETDQQLDGIIGDSAKIREVLRMIGRLKDSWTPVLICGESGNGERIGCTRNPLSGGVCAAALCGGRLRRSGSNADGK